jgi:hypothetical protein
VRRGYNKKGVQPKPTPDVAPERAEGFRGTSMEVEPTLRYVCHLTILPIFRDTERGEFLARAWKLATDKAR